MKVYLVFEEVDKDGGYGDAISTIEPVAVFRDETDAVNYVNKHSKPKVYDSPYDKLYSGGLDYQELELH